MKHALSFFLKFAPLLFCVTTPLIAMRLPPFEKSFYPVVYAKNDNGEIFTDLYNSYVNDFTLSEEYLIPKIIHFVWLGSPLPSGSQKLVDTWKQFHPEWIVKVWNDEDVKSFNLENQQAYDAAKNYGEKSDIFRYEMLYRHGGVYVDTDFECLKPFDELHRSCGFYTGIQACNSCVLNGMIGSRPGHPILKACIDNISPGPGDQDYERIMTYTGPYHFTKMILSYLESENPEKIVCLPPSMLYPFPGAERFKMTDQEKIKRKYVRKESLAIHYWWSSWK